MGWREDRLSDLQDLEQDKIIDVIAMTQIHHLSWVLSEMFETYLLKDACIVSSENLYKEAHKIADILANFYQLIAQEVYAIELLRKDRL